ncbi:helix-turn-helix transcriptional regulator [Nocardioides sp. LML1-1-1.1]|uniref:helix-turn-helix transcriptional regulator n=1 Tax=Nocardioides sp. LML1-1-1.1 TaxID=3135248 RepID=UPI0034162FDC
MLYPWGDKEPDALGGRLSELGLDTDAERVYRALLTDPEADRETIRDAIGISEPDLHQALGRLAALALVHDAGDQPRLINPDAALTALLAQYESDIASRKVRLEESRMAIGQLLEARHAAAPDSLDIERVIGLDAVRRRIEELSQRCSHTIWSFNPGGAQSAENLRRSRPLNQETLARGVRMRAVYLDSVLNDEATVEHINWLSDLGGEVRVTPTLPLRMIVVDSEVVMVPLDDDSAQGAMVVTGRGMVTALSALFTSTWRTSKPFGPRRHRERGQLNEQEMQALRLWAQGRTDRAVANALGVSERTVRRMAESINARLGARSRFEAGVRARDTGLLTSEDLL